MITNRAGPLAAWSPHIGVAAALSILFAGLVWSAAAQKSETIDEGLFIGLGVAQFERADPNVDLTHPPLLRWLAGSSAVVLGNARLPDQPVPSTPLEVMDLSGNKLAEEFAWTKSFFYSDTHAHDRVLFWGRFPFALLAILTGGLLYREASRHLDPVSALGGLAIFLFTPEILAHAQWAHSDLAAALTTFLVALALARSLERDSRPDDLLLGAALGLAVMVKLTGLALIPVCLGILLVSDLREERQTRSLLLRFALRVATIGGVVWIVVVASHLPRPRLFTPHEFRVEDLSILLHAPPDAGLVQFSQSVLRSLPLPDNFLKGIVYTLLLSQRGQTSWFHGESGLGWWYYYPAAIFLKYPTSTLLLALTGLSFVSSSDRLSFGRKVAWTAIPASLLVLAMTNKVNIGVRAVLPLVPFFALWSAYLLYRMEGRLRSAAAWGLVAISVCSGVLSYPNFLAYFNPIVGGTEAADRWLVDSNYDWGQSLPQLRDAMDRHGIDRVHLAYFGVAKPEHYGIRTLSADLHQTGWYAISRSYLTGWWPPEDPYGWLREIPPTELPGGSIALIHVRRDDLDDRSSGSETDDPPDMMRTE